MNRNLLLIISIFLCLTSALAQTKVVKITAVKSNDYGVRYTLPKTVLTFTVDYTQTQKKAGPYAKYASRYLGIRDADVIMENQTSYALDKIAIEEHGVPNKDQSYLVSFRAKTTAPFVYLTPDGLICSINADYQPEPVPAKTEPAPVPESPKLNPQSIYTEEYLHAGSVAKMAEVAAKNIYRIRESRQDLLTGEVDNVPKDGEAMKIILNTLDAQEKLWMELFIGSTETQTLIKQLTIEPVAAIAKEILFRFSRHLGIVAADDLSGAPVYWDLKDLKTVSIPQPDPKKKAKEPQGIVYNIPGKASVEIYTPQQRMGATTVNVTQFGTTETLAPELFEDKKAPVQVIFYPNTGAVRRVIQ